MSELDAPSFPPLVGVLVMLLGAYVALDAGRRVHRLGAVERRPWLLATALALGCGLWGAAVLGLTDRLDRMDAGFDAMLVAFSALATLALALAGSHWVHGAGRSRLQALAGAALLGGAATAAQLLVILSLGLKPGIDWHFGWLGLAWLICSAGFAWSLQAPTAAHSSASPWHRQLASTAVMASTVLTGQALSLQAAGLHTQSLLPSAALVPAATLQMLASIGGAELLLLMLLACAVEARVRNTLDKARSALQEQTCRDELTGLPNRISFEGTLAQAQQQAEAAQAQLAVLLVGLDGFKHINENFGHQFGDRLLRRMAHRLRGLVRPHSASRLGSDEFLLLLTGPQAALQAPALAAQVLEAIAQPCSVDTRELAMTCSIGIALYPQHGAMSALITNAEVAMRASKGAGGGTYSLFDARMVVDTREQAELLRDLRMALARAQLELYYQPKIHAPSAQITGVEALLRWHHPTRGMISPNIFIPMAERSGLINALGAWVIDEACRQARVWRDQGLRMRVAVNLSAHQLRQPELPQHIAAALARHQINPDLLTCEITESVAMEDTEATIRLFTELAAVGVHIAIDDFGSGYSSLACLRKLPAGELKIDRSFVLDLECSEEARTIAGAVVQLAQALNLKVVAEGVETEQQFQILRQLGCDELQGFLFAKPMSAKALALWAIADEGPRSIQFSASLFKETQTVAL